jgi:ABC-type transport system involved in multi-copper enzyme maturation permease subunit
MSNFLKSIRLIRIISCDVFRAAFKERMMYGFLVLSLLFVLLANMPFLLNDPRLFDGLSPKAASIQIGFMGINIFLMLICVFLSLNVLQDILCDHNLTILLSKPVRRWHILEGIFLGLFKIIFLNWLIMVAILWSLIYFYTRQFHINILIGMSISLILSMIYISLAIFFYSLVPNFISGVLTFFIIIAGFGVSLSGEYFKSLPGFLFFWIKLGTELIPKINSLFGISMDILEIFKLKINYLLIFLHTFIFLIVINILSCLKFSRSR